MRLNDALGAGILLCALLAFAPLSGAQERHGQPLVTAPAVAETTAEIMSRQAVVPPRTTPRIQPFFRADWARKPNPDALPSAIQPKALVSGGTEPKVAQTGSTNFLGGRLFDAQAFPPDSMGAVGPSQFIVAINGRFRSFDKLSGTPDGVLDVDSDVFFASVMTPVGGSVAVNFTSDPRIRYDRSTGRWFIVMIDVPLTSGGGFNANRVMIAVSDTAQITTATSWRFFQFTPGNFADYPTLGIDKFALYVGTNIFNLAGTAFINTDAYVLNKASLLGTGPASVTVFHNMITDVTCTSGDGPFTPQGVDNVDSSATQGYFIGVSACFFGRLILNRVSTPGGSPTMSAPINVNVATTNYPLTVPHLGNTGGTNGYLDSLDDRLMSAQVRNGQLYTAHAQPVDSTGATNTVRGTARNGARWYRITNLSGSPTVADFGTIFDNTAQNSDTGNVRWYTIPGINVNGQGHVAIGFTAAGPMLHPNAAFSGRLVTDPAGAMDAPTLYTNTLAAYNPSGDPGGGGGRRWGDYSYTSVDPNDDMTMWTVQEYADATNSWAVRVARLNAPPPATPSGVSVPSIPTGTASTTFTLTGTSSGGSGFFDPGSGFANRLSVEVVPGVTVTGVTVVDSTHLNVTVSTVGAPVGAKVIRVINPDGQVAGDSGNLLTITGSAPPTINSANSTICAVGSACNFTFTTLPGPAPATIGLSGALPAGVTFAAGALSGTPAAGTQGSYPLTVTASNGTPPDATQSFTLVVTAQCGGFTDVTGTDAFCNAAEWLKNRGITTGCSSTQYCPTFNVTRAQMALFMQRLGDAISPTVYSDNVLSTGGLTIDNRPTFCTTPDFLPVNFPRVALVHWSFEGNASAPLTARVWSQTSFDNGGSYASNDLNFMRVNAQASGWVGASATVKVNVPAGASPRFRLRIDREAGTTTSGNFVTGRCNVSTLMTSVNGGASPFDPPAGAGEQ